MSNQDDEAAHKDLQLSCVAAIEAFQLEHKHFVIMGYVQSLAFQILAIAIVQAAHFIPADETLGSMKILITLIPSIVGWIVFILGCLSNLNVYRRVRANRLKNHDKTLSVAISGLSLMMSGCCSIAFFESLVLANRHYFSIFGYICVCLGLLQVLFARKMHWSRLWW